MRISINVVILVPESKNHHTTMITPLTAISPVDGRYRNKTEKLADYFSEAALIRYRIRVEIEYFIALCELPLPQLEGIDHARFTTCAGSTPTSPRPTRCVSRRSSPSPTTT